MASNFDELMNGFMEKMMENMMSKVMENMMNSMESAMAKALNPTPSTDGLHFEKEKERKPVAAFIGSPVWQEDFSSVYCEETSEGKKVYRGYSHCPLGGEKGKSIKYAIKQGFKEYGAKFTGDVENVIDLQWTFPNQKMAKEYIKHRKELVALKKEA